MRACMAEERVCAWLKGVTEWILKRSVLPARPQTPSQRPIPCGRDGACTGNSVARTQARPSPGPHRQLRLGVCIYNLHIITGTCIRHV